jgi:hypothetical protein
MVAKYNFFILEVQKAWIAPSTKAPADNSPSGKREVHGCWQDDQVAFENEMTSVVRNEMGDARSIRLRNSSSTLKQVARLQDRTPTFPVGLTEAGRIAESPPISPSLCTEELVPAP